MAGTGAGVYFGDGDPVTPSPRLRKVHWPGQAAQAAGGEFWLNMPMGIQTDHGQCDSLEIFVCPCVG